jgi:flagellar biosynthesis protein FliR
MRERQRVGVGPRAHREKLTTMLNTPAIVRFALLIVRPGMVVVAAPMFGASYVPAPVRIGLGVLLGLIVAPLISPPLVTEPVGIFVTVASEMLIGIALGMGVRLLVAAAELAGHMIGFQMGLSYSALVDPQSGVRNGMLAALYANLAMVIFLAIDGHHTLVRALADSYSTVPIGGMHTSGPFGTLVAQMLGLVFATGVRLAAPVVTVLLIVELALGLISRAAPSLNLMVVGAPIRLLAGLAALAIGVQVASPVIIGIARSAVDASLKLLHALA